MGKIEDELTPEEQQVFDKIFDEVLNDMVECGMITKTNENGTDYYSFQPSEEKDEVKTKCRKLLEKYEEALFFAHTHIENLNKIIVKQKELIKVLQEKKEKNKD